MARPTRQLSIKDCYEILKLQKGADLQAVKTAYRKRAFELHPDLNPGNRDAQRQFQLLNEAYVALSAMLKPAEEARQKSESQKREKAQKEEAQEGKAGEEHTGEPGNAEKARAQQAYAEQDVLRDLLNDPFARRVFEDIYSEMAKKQKQEEPAQEEKKAEAPHEKPQASAKPAPEFKKSAPVMEVQGNDSGKGITGVLKKWFRKQIDEELHLSFPAARLAPGKKIPLSISYGLTNTTHNFEITLPQNFVAGKPMRLKGLGKRIGRLQGDLYLTIHSL